MHTTLLQPPHAPSPTARTRRPHPLAATAAAAATLLLGACQSPDQTVLVSVPEQRMLVVDKENRPLGVYTISTSKFGLGDQRGSYRTPLGKFEVASKIGDRVPPGGVLKGRRFTGEVLPPNAPGRDPIISRILWLKGNDHHNCNAYHRYIYIHGTPEERTLGTPASYGCIRMSSRDVIDLFDKVDRGARVVITTKRLPGSARRFAARQQPQPPPHTHTLAAANTNTPPRP